MDDFVNTNIDNVINEISSSSSDDSVCLNIEESSSDSSYESFDEGSDEELNDTKMEKPPSKPTIDYEDTIEYEDIDGKLRCIIRKPQSGKTFICIKDIETATLDLHMVMTMNTIKSNKQFFGRIYEKLGRNKIIIFNSDKNYDKDYDKNYEEIMK